MIENIDLTKAPQDCGVYFFKDVNDEIIYVGSSCNLYNRMKSHRSYIKKGKNSEDNKELYQFLQNNSFTLEYLIEENYRQLEENLIEEYKPKFNRHRAQTGLGGRKGREIEYNSEYYQKFKDECKIKRKIYYESRKEQILEKTKKYHRDYYQKNKEVYKERDRQRCQQKCNYNGEIISFEALRSRFRYRGIPHPTLEAKKYLIPTA